jgi:hypothetical protein
MACAARGSWTCASTRVPFREELPILIT